MSRPSFKPTREQRKLVKSLAAIGMRHDRMATLIGLRSPKTLRKYFRRELSVGSTEAFATISRTAHQMAISGEFPEMTDWWLSTMDASSDERDFAEADELEPQPRSTLELVFAGPVSGKKTAAEVSNA